MFLAASIIGINIADNIANIDIKLNPTDIDNTHTLLNSKTYLQIFNFLYLFVSSCNCDSICLNNSSNLNIIYFITNINRNLKKIFHFKLSIILILNIYF